MPDVKDSWCMLPDIRYDKIFAEMGCHTEFVTEPQEIRPALERSFKSGKTSVLNIIPDDSVVHLSSRPLDITVNFLTEIVRIDKALGGDG